ncbi:hypothetical protein OH807_11780 [Kitasatospora sp. NBC_01560]|uniref:hypothetical protein n=1 Tax=Kitasatospora sp. NBC_01560 TaxID=2975965 RepID=UPI003862DBB3
METTDPGTAAGTEDPTEAADLLTRTAALRAGARARLDGSGVPLLGFGLLSLAAVPFARQAFNFGSDGRDVESYATFAYAELTGLCVPHAPDAPCQVGEFDGSVLRFAAWGIWFALIPLAWLALARWFRVRGEERGIVPRRGAWVGGALGATAVVVIVVPALLFLRRQPFTATVLENRYASPWYAVGVGLLALGLVERSRIAVAAALAHVALLSAYLAAPWGSSWTPWPVPGDGAWADGPQLKALLLAAVLLAAGLAQRRVARRRAAATAGRSGTVTPARPA